MAARAAIRRVIYPKCERTRRINAKITTKATITKAAAQNLSAKLNCDFFAKVFIAYSATFNRHFRYVLKLYH
jgi:hypothetical protein